MFVTLLYPIMSRYKHFLLNYALPLGFVAVLYLTGLHTPFLGYLQQGVLATGLLQPNTELAETENVPSDIIPTTENLDFKMIDPQGGIVNAKDLTGKVVFLNLWASWCPPCLAEMPNIDALHADYADDDRITFVLLNVETDFTRGKELVAGRGYDFPIYQLSSSLPASLGSSSLPTTFVIAPGGEVIVTHKGMADYDTKKFRALLDELIDRVSNQ